MIHFDFGGKTVLVTGSSRGMGAVILEHFARAGAVCLLNYVADASGQNSRDAEETAGRLRAHNVPVYLLEANVSNYDAVASLMKQVVNVTGGLDILVNNAGILRDRTVKKMTLAEWQAVIQTNLDGVFYCSKLGLEVMRDGGRIVNTSSLAALLSFPGQANYAAAKAGVIALTRVLAKEVAQRRITVNAVAPGIIRTSMLDALRPEVLAEYEKQIPLGRIGRPEDVANAVLFLASAESEYITGQVLPITGGWY